MAEQFVDPSTRGQQNSFDDQIRSHPNVVTVPNTYYVTPPQAEPVPPVITSVDYLDPSTGIAGYEQHPYHDSDQIPPRSTDITDISRAVPGSGDTFVTLGDGLSQQTHFNTSSTGQQQQYFSADLSERSSRPGGQESMEALTRSAFELLQGVVAEASNDYDVTSRGSADRGQYVSLLPPSQPLQDASMTGQVGSGHGNVTSWAASTGTTIILDAQNSLMGGTGISVAPTLSHEPAQLVTNSGLASGGRVIKVVSQKPTSTALGSGGAGKGQYRCVLVKDPDNTQKNRLVIRPTSEPVSAASSGNTVTAGQKSLVSVTGPTPAMKLSDSVEQEILDMIRKTSASFTIKGTDAMKTGLLEISSTSDSASISSTARYFCSTCKERYNQKEGFQYHLQRISFVLKYNCLRCSTIFTFFNKCALWLHLNDHNENIDYQRVNSLDPYDFASNPNVFNNDMKSSVVTDSKEIMNKMRRETQGIEKCPICMDFCRNLPIHLKRSDGKHHAYLCHVCQIYLPNKCSLLAHDRLHRGSTAQLCCPECGLVWKQPSNKLKEVFDHIDACMHFNRAEAYFCDCKVSSPSLTEAKKHFVENHTKPLSKCPSCSVAFTDSKLLDAHWARNPRCQPKGRQEPKVTRLCTLCKSVMTTVMDAKQHVQKHISHQAQLSWMCFLCSMMFPTANELRIHCEEDHPHRAKRCTLCFKLFCNRKLLVDHILNKTCSMTGKHSLCRCVDMPSKPPIDLEAVFAALFKMPSQPQTTLSSVAHSSAGRTPDRSNASTPQQEPEGSPRVEQPDSSQQSPPAQAAQVASNTPPESGQDNGAPSGRQRPKVAIRKPASLDNTTSELLEEMQQWMSKDGREIVPTVTPPPKKRGRPKQEKRPPHHLVCGVSSKGISYQCHPCKIIVTGTNNYISHMKYHENKGDCSYGAFCHCSVCDKLIGSHLIIKHLRDHQSKGIIVCCRCQRRDFGDLDDAIQHAHDLCEYRKIGGSVAQTQTENYISGRESTSVITTQRQALTSVESVPPMDTEQVVEAQIDRTVVSAAAKTSLHPCHLCGITFENIILRDQHVRKAHGGTRKVYHCLACEKKKVLKTFTSQITARKHVTKKHRVVQRALVDRCLKEVNASVASGKTQATALAAGDDEDEPEESGSAEASAPKRLRLGGQGDFLCGKCGYSSSAEDYETFAKHIRTHNLKQEPQCPECGLCYTVMPAIKRHLFAVHKIRNVDEYLIEKGITEEQEEEDEFDEVLSEMLPGARSLPPNTRQQNAPAAVRARKEPADDDGECLECNVCYRSFDTEANLKTHMRTHGMAFIRSKRYKPL